MTFPTYSNPPIRLLRACDRPFSDFASATPTVVRSEGAAASAAARSAMRVHAARVLPRAERRDMAGVERGKEGGARRQDEHVRGRC